MSTTVQVCARVTLSVAVWLSMTAVSYVPALAAEGDASAPARVQELEAAIPLFRKTVAELSAAGREVEAADARRELQDLQREFHREVLRGKLAEIERLKAETKQLRLLAASPDVWRFRIRHVRLDYHRIPEASREELSATPHSEKARPDFDRLLRELADTGAVRIVADQTLTVRDNETMHIRLTAVADENGRPGIPKTVETLTTITPQSIGGGMASIEYEIRLNWDIGGVDGGGEPVLDISSASGTFVVRDGQTIHLGGGSSYNRILAGTNRDGTENWVEGPWTGSLMLLSAAASEGRGDRQGVEADIDPAAIGF